MVPTESHWAQLLPRWYLPDVSSALVLAKHAVQCWQSTLCSAGKARCAVLCCWQCILCIAMLLAMHSVQCFVAADAFYAVLCCCQYILCSALLLAKHFVQCLVAGNAFYAVHCCWQSILCSALLLAAHLAQYIIAGKAFCAVPCCWQRILCSEIHHTSSQEKEAAPQQSDLLLHLPEMNACFGQSSVEDIHASLKQLDNDWSKEALKLMNG